MLSAATVGHREVFRDLRALLESQIDFEEIASWGPKKKRPVLMIGAANVSTGSLTKFVSFHHPIRVEHILASCAVPNIFPAVMIDGSAYWDGLFSDNPPLQELMRPDSVGADNLPEEVWLIKINPTTCDRVPELPDDISDRRNQIVGVDAIYLATVWAIPVIIAITLHEAAHGFVAHLLGDDTAWRLGRVSFNPLKHVDPFGTILLPGILLLLRSPFIFGYAKPVPVNFRALRWPRRGMMLVAAAGPAMNIALAVAAALVFRHKHLNPQLPRI
jgi:hypothetical protein